MKILVVDDEILIREWLLFCLKGNTEIEVVGCASNGQQALMMVEQLSPDIVLTDIKMPVMDGIELLREIRKISPNIAVILLTAYNEFEYARQAIREGANEYMLKTEISNESLNEMLSKINKELNLNQQQASPLEKPLVIKELLLKEGRLNENDLSLLKGYGITNNQGYYVALAFNNCEILSNFSLPKLEHATILCNIESDETVSVMLLSIDAYSEDEGRNYLHQIITSMHKQNQCKIGMSHLMNDSYRLNDIVNEAIFALSKGFYENGLIFNCDLTYQKRLECMHQDSYRMKQLIQEIYRLIGKNQLLIFHEAMEELKQLRFYNIDALKKFSKEIVEMIHLRYTSETNNSKELLKDVKIQITKSLQIEDVNEIVGNFAKTHLLNDDLDESGLSKNVAQAVAYIRTHYQEAISLSEIADYVNLNAEYFSRIFKEETNQTYSTFLANIRLTKAESLLINSHIKVFEIAEAVGYPNVSYFSTIFKKKYGMNPYEFRRANENSLR